MRPFVRSIVTGLAALAILSIGAVVSLVAFMWVEHRTAVELPAPTGPYTVGRVISEAGEATGEQRHVRIWLWYPSAVPPAAATDVYLPRDLRSAVERERGPLISRFLTRDLSSVRTHSVGGAELSSREPAYPVVILIGGGAAGAWNYSALAEDLASHGYVVAGADNSHPSPRDNPERCLSVSSRERERCVERALRARISDIDLTLGTLSQLNAGLAGRFAGRLDMTRVGVMGHSFGGATALQFCAEDRRCKAGIDLDGAPQGSVVQTGLGRPFMFLLSDHTRETDAESRRIMAEIRAIYERLPPNGRLWIAIRGANHFTFSDDGAVLKSNALRGLLHLLGKLGIDGRRQLALTSYCVHTFFDGTFRGPRSPKFDRPSMPEIQVLR